MLKFITDFETWLLDYGDRLYRYLVYKRMFTPENESEYEDNHYELCQIAEAIDLGGDWLLGLRTIEEDGKIYGMIHYYKLSEIRLAFFENDQHIELYEEEKNDNEL